MYLNTWNYIIYVRNWSIIYMHNTYVEFRLILYSANNYVLVFNR